jgi:hypothetical protein
MHRNRRECARSARLLVADYWPVCTEMYRFNQLVDVSHNNIEAVLRLLDPLGVYISQRNYRSH